MWQRPSCVAGFDGQPGWAVDAHGILRPAGRLPIPARLLFEARLACGLVLGRPIPRAGVDWWYECPRCEAQWDGEWWAETGPGDCRSCGVRVDAEFTPAPPAALAAALR